MISVKASAARVLRRLVGRVEHDGRVGVAVAGVRHHRDVDLPCRAAMAAIAGQQGRQLGDRCADVLQQQGAAALEAGKKLRRASANISPSSASSVVKHSVAPCLVQAASASSISAEQAAPGASDWISSSAPAVRSRPIFRASSTMLIEALSISSTIDGRATRPSSTTARAAASGIGERRRPASPSAAAPAPAAGWPG